MTEIGYYNYYNMHGRRNVDKPDDWYQKMVNHYESDDLRSKSDIVNPYSDLNQSTHALEEKLASWAERLERTSKNRIKMCSALFEYFLKFLFMI